ncbi:MAG: hypothetical protein M3Q06_13580, partial [Bacteroidota bacterium]|nr:hypothetical protein [Bacteroidota bacterium]
HFSTGVAADWRVPFPAVLPASGIEKEEAEKQSLASPAANAGKQDTLGGKKVSEADLRPLFIQRLQQLLNKTTNGLYTVAVGDMKVDVLASSISLHDVELQPDAKNRASLQAAGLLPSNVFTISFQRLDIEGVNLDDALTSKTMDYKTIRLVNPVIRIDRFRSKEKKPEGDFSQRFLKELEKLSIKNLSIEGGSIVVNDKQKGSTKTLSNVQVRMTDILLDSSTRNDKSRFLFAQNARIHFGDYSSTSKDGLYRFRIGNADVFATEKRVVLKNLSFKPTLSREAFASKHKVAKEMYTLLLPQLTITGADWWSALNEEEVMASAIETNGGSLAIYLNREKPPANKMGNFPSQLLQKLPVKLAVNKAAIRNLDLQYEEYNPLSKQNGTLYFDNASIHITNMHNGTGNGPMEMKGTAQFMHSIPIEASFRFDMARAKSGAFTASLRADKDFDGSLLNSFTVPLGMMKVEKGSLQKLQVDMQGDETGAKGEVEVLYQDLKLAMLEKDKGEAALDKKSVTSLFANLFVLKKSNPKKDEAPRKEPAQFKRDPTGGFFMLVWKTALTGILKTIGAPEKIAYKKPKPAEK